MIDTTSILLSDSRYIDDGSTLSDMSIPRILHEFDTSILAESKSNVMMKDVMNPLFVRVEDA